MFPLYVLAVLSALFGLFVSPHTFEKFLGGSLMRVFRQVTSNPGR